MWPPALSGPQGAGTEQAIVPADHLPAGPRALHCRLPLLEQCVLLPLHRFLRVMYYLVYAGPDIWKLSTSNFNRRLPSPREPTRRMPDPMGISVIWRRGSELSRRWVGPFRLCVVLSVSHTDARCSHCCFIVTEPPKQRSPQKIIQLCPESQARLRQLVILACRSLEVVWWKSGPAEQHTSFGMRWRRGAIEQPRPVNFLHLVCPSFSLNAAGLPSLQLL